MQRGELIERLASHRTVGGAPREELVWMAEHGAFRSYQPGESVVRQSDVVDELVILLSGRMSIWVNRGNGRRKFMEWRAGDVTGLLPYSRLLHPPGDTIVEETIDALVLNRDDLPGLIRNCHEVTSRLVHTMTDRARQFTSADLRDEKLVSLGKLSAGLAHELNNPASAIMRNAKSMATVLTAAEESHFAIAAARLSDTQLAALARVRGLATQHAAGRDESGLALADREEEIAGWIAAHRASVESAPDLARSGVTIDTLDRLAEQMQGGQLDTALRSIAAGTAVHALASDLERAAARIHALVTAVKRFTHMDQDHDQGPVDIAAGLADTVALLDGKARSRSVSIALNLPPDLPPAYGVGTEINQVWMNLIDNAIDAAPTGGHVVISAAREGPSVIVRVVDDGPGIPGPIIGSIFDPFFTTKPIGEGTGLGLDIVRRIIDLHHGEVEVSSAPGRTEFRVGLPALS